MKAFITFAVFTLALVGFANFSQADDVKMITPEQESHHVEQATSTSKETNRMDMESVMQDCMKMHKDHKDCRQENMKSCETKMSKKECANVMKNMKPMKIDNK